MQLSHLFENPRACNEDILRPKGSLSISQLNEKKRITCNVHYIIYRLYSKAASHKMWKLCSWDINKDK